ncbi:DUF4159 domain-containing protein [Thalassospira sp.]|uniref:DUF4159 domain-containing protein n=1 Tax=Thalassospira sp. TaxID=1912094 RepID=UPI0027351BE2|nr:DUF4159 domain-containing protein [Thalassospira sp.]MDP2696590.1 DUF4159 domain-containing protein [Thalassospira sp.]
MMVAGISFVYPAMLAGLILLPVLWLIIRSAPRAPRRLVFPAARLLLGLSATRREARRAPIWQTILRSLILTALIVAAARPVMHRADYAGAPGSILLIAETGWSAAAHWQEYRRGMQQVLDQARSDGHSIYVARSAPEPSGATDTALSPIIGPLSPRAADQYVDRLHPVPWPSDYIGLSDLISNRQDITTAVANVIWMTDDLVLPGKEKLADDLSAIAPVTILRPQQTDQIVVHDMERTRNGMQVTLHHNRIDTPRNVALLARDDRGRVLLQHDLVLDPATSQTTGDILLPGDITNAIQSIGLRDVESAATLYQTGAGWQQRKVGIIVSSGETPQLLSDRFFFLDRAISPFASIAYGPLGDLLQDGVDILVAAGPISGVASQRAPLSQWIDAGGMLVRFAGLQDHGSEQGFLPVTLRLGNRDFGGSMSWEKPKRLVDFPETSPFFGIDVPNDITVNRQLLAEPDADIVQKTWARLDDGTPLITSAPQNAGRIVLFHVTPWADWSGLPMSGLFVELWQRLLPLASPSDQSANDLQTALPAQSVLDGYGRSHQSDAMVLPLRGTPQLPDPRHPPGIYGSNGQAIAVNLGHFLTGLDQKIRWPDGVVSRTLTGQDQIDLAALCLLTATVLLMLDTLILLAINHVSAWRARRYAMGKITGFLVLVLTGYGLISGHPAQATNNSEAALQPRLAYLQTNVAAIDRLSHSGLAGLSEILRRRSAASLAAPHGIDPETDDLSFYPLIYWPLNDGQQQLSDFARDKLNRYLDGGGMILIDSRDREVQPARLRHLLAGLEIPILDRAPSDHIIFRSFYLLDQAYGRFEAPLWLDATPDTRLDGVASVLFGGNDWAAAWTLPQETDADTGQPPVARLRPDDITAQQHEMALRFGVNLVMYALTGSYKGDQVHLPAILERLGR